VINRRCVQIPAHSFGQLRAKVQQRQTVTAPRNRNSQPRWPCHRRPQSKKQGSIRAPLPQSQIRSTPYWHASPCIETCASVAEVVPIKRLTTSPSVTQASCVWPNSPRP
jgi:hypothetical protein